MSFEEFYSYVVSALKEKCGEDVELCETMINKNNNQNYWSVTLKKAGCLKAEYAPTVCIMNFYRHYQEEDGVYSVDMAVEDIWDILVNGFTDMDVNPNDITNFETAREMLRLHLVNKEKNKESLEEVPHIDYLDMSIVPYLLVKKGNDARLSSAVTPKLLEMWAADPLIVLQTALENTLKMHRAELMDMSELLTKFYRMPEGACIGRDIMYVLSNEDHLDGAIVITYKGLLEEIAEKLGDDLILIPSSVHEFMLLRKSDCKDYKGLKELVWETNTTLVKPEETLSDSLYLYERSKKRIRMYHENEVSS